MKIGVRDVGRTALDIRLDGILLWQGSREYYGNGGPGVELLDFLTKYRSEIQDAFRTGDELYILPSSKRFAAMLASLLSKDGHDKRGERFADEIDWVKLGDRYWLRLWWD